MKSAVKPKKHLGQHFLIDQNIALKIVDSLDLDLSDNVIEVGPGTGVLTKYLKEKTNKLLLSEVDQESVVYLVKEYGFSQQDFTGDFLKMDLRTLEEHKLSVIGNFPYNISSQIFFKVLENRDIVVQCVGMIQKEVAERITAGHGNKQYGILSVLLQAYFDIEYLFTVNETVFNPPPKVKSAVIRLKRNDVSDLGVSFKHFKKLVKVAFNTRRKTLRNSLKPLNLPKEITQQKTFDKRAEQLSVSEFVELAKITENC